jgi:hypothetical protein
MWHEVSRVEFKNIASNNSTGAKLVTLIQSLILLILTQTFEAFYVANESLAETITSPAQVSGRSIATWSDYASTVEGMGGKPVLIGPESPQDVADFFANSSFDGALFDDVLLEVTQYLYPDLYISVSGVYEFGTGILFNGDADDAMIAQISEAIEAVNKQYPYSQRLQDFIQSYYPSLKTFSGDKEPLVWSSFTFGYFFPIYMIYAVGLGIGILCGCQDAICKKISRHLEKRKIIYAIKDRREDIREKTIHRSKRRVTSIIKFAKKPMPASHKLLFRDRIDAAIASLGRERAKRRHSQKNISLTTVMLDQYTNTNDEKRLLHRLAGTQSSLFKYATNYKVTIQLRKQFHYDVRGGKEDEIKIGILRMLHKYHAGLDAGFEKERKEIAKRIWCMLNRVATTWTDNDDNYVSLPQSVDEFGRDLEQTLFTNPIKTVNTESFASRNSFLWQ